MISSERSALPNPKICFLMTLFITSAAFLFFGNGFLPNDFNYKPVLQMGWQNLPRFQNSPNNKSVNATERTTTIEFTRATHAVTPSKSLTSYRDEEALVDNRSFDLPELFNETVDELRSFPRQTFMLDGSTPEYNKSCARFPNIMSIEFHNTYWQKMATPIGNVYFYGAYYDNRNLTINQKEISSPAVRILGMMDWDLHLKNDTEYYCQMWFDKEKKPVFSQVVDQRFIWKYGKAKLQIFLFACNISKPFQDKVPSSVSVVVNQCDHATNNLRVQYEKPVERKDFAVCVKGLDFRHEDLSVRLVEWIELLRLLGADKIFLYEFAAHPNASKVLRHYENSDFVDVTPLTLPGGYPNDPRLRHIYLKKKITEKRSNELIPYNDCLYRNLYNYKYVALLDPDELIVPLNTSTWKELFSQLKDEHPKDFESHSSIAFRNVYFFASFMENRTWFPNIPKYMHHLQHVYRSSNYSAAGAAAKCLHNTDRVISLHNHFPIHCFEKCKSLHVKTNLAQLQHYKPECPGSLKNCSVIFGQNPVFDNNLWRYKDELIYNTVDVLRTLGFISNSSAESWWFFKGIPRIKISDVFKLKT